MSTSSSELCSSTSIKNAKSKILSKQCLICGAPVECSYLGVLSCRSCKMFFKRAGDIDQTKLTCPYNNQCKIDINNRHTCRLCRLTKCLEYGMHADKFRASIASNKKSDHSTIKPTTNILSNIKTHQKPEQLSALNLLQSDQSLLTTSQWNIISNLLNCYKESELLSIGKRLLDTQNAAQLTNMIDPILLQEFLTSIYETAGSCLRSNGDLSNLTSSDRSITIRSAADNVSCLSFGLIAQLCHLFDLGTFFHAMEAIYGRHSVDLHLHAMKFIDPDFVVCKLALSLFAVTENSYAYHPNVSTNFTNYLVISDIQNKYAEVTWKYLLYKYGHHQAVKRFLNLINWLGANTIVLSHAQTIALHVNDVDSIAEQTELALILDEAEQMLETN